MRIALCTALGLATVAVVATSAHEPHRFADARVFSAWDQTTLAGLMVLGVLYTVGADRLRRRGASPRAIEHAAFAGGWLTLVAAILPWFDVAAIARFSAHMAQHELMMVVAAPLIVAGRPLATCLCALPERARRVVAAPIQHRIVATAVRRLTAPATAFAVHGAVLWIWHLPALYERAVQSEPVHALQHAMFVATSLMFWSGLVRGRYGRAGYGAAVVYVFTTAVHTGILGALLTFARSPLYAVYASLAGRNSDDALADQQLAGLIMWIPAGMILTLMAIALFAAWLGEAERRSRVGDSRLKVHPLHPPPQRNRRASSA